MSSPPLPPPNLSERVDPSVHSPARRRRPARRGRPRWVSLVGLAVVAQVVWMLIDGARIRLGSWAISPGWSLVAVVALSFRWVMHRRARAGDGREFTTEMLLAQVAESELGGPAFPEDGTVFGASVLVVNQRTKMIEAVTEYEVFDHAGQRLAVVRQIGQSRTKRVVRLLWWLDQFFTHHFDVIDADGAVVMRLTRPRKLYMSRVNVFDGMDRYLGCIRQYNMIGRIRFGVEDASGQTWAFMTADNLRAWDFSLVGSSGLVFAEVVKSWEGWMRTFLSPSDRYVSKVHVPLPEPLRSLTLAWVLTIDLALKQDARGLGRF